MVTRKLLLWFEKRRKSRTLTLAQQQITEAINTVNELEKALTAFSKNERKAVEESIQRLFTQEVEIDNLRREVFKELARDNLPTKFREDLKELVENLDIMADHVKDCARSIKTLMLTTIPKSILDEYINIAKYLSAGALALGECSEMLGVDPAMAKVTSEKVDHLEEKVDDAYISIKVLLIKHSTMMDAATLLELRDLLNNMEYVADKCADTAEYIRVLATEEIPTPKWRRVN
ncbi:DUF47 family protein [Candidatus Bathyarchaeota archaeon]|nr:DUF47 family protein [Candidatus Bathyarchaeota archaeon]